MESWRFVVDDSVSENGLLSSEMKSPWSYNCCNSMSSNQGGDQIQEFVDLDSSYMKRESLPNDSIGDAFAGKVSDGRVVNSVSVPPNEFSCEDDSSSIFSSSVVEFSARDSSLIDLKLGRLSDQGDGKAFSASAAKTNFSSSESFTPVKRARAGGVGSQTPYCQVHGCRKDLSSCKDYHKRHKVCEIHSKTTKVIVNGIEQRFCQQCSRFHLLAEFDDGKRSCRKRLAGHNERRRKPHIHIHAGRAGRLFQSSNIATRLEGSSLSASSFVCQDLLPTSHLRDNNNLSGLVKLEDGTNLSSHLTITDDVRQKSSLTQYTPEKQCHSLQNDGLSVMTKREINGNNLHFQHIADSSFESRSAFPSFPLGNQDMSVLDSSSTIGGLSEIANSGRALSLLSSHSQCSSMSTSGVPTVLPLVSSGSRALYGLKPPEKLLGMSSQVLASGMSSAFSSSLLSSAEKNAGDNMLISNSGAGTYGIDPVLQQSAYLNNKNHFPFQQGSTINLLQLSTQLQRVEHQRQSSMMKHEDDDFSIFRNT